MRELIRKIQLGYVPSAQEVVGAWGEHIAPLTELKNTPQDVTWHAEGDVLAHTDLVLERTKELLDGQLAHITDDRRLVLVIAAALHDVAKPLTTREREIDSQVRIVSPHHETTGRSLLAPLLMDQGLAYSLVEEIMAQVGYHIEPKFLVVKNRPSGAYRRLSRLADPQLLYGLELADMQGREADDRDEQVEYIELFKLGAKEAQAWRRFGEFRSPFVTAIRDKLGGFDQSVIDKIVGLSLRDLESGIIQSAEEAIARSYSHRELPPELIVMVGPSGSGKSSWINRHLDDHAVVSLDELRTELTGNRSNQDQNSHILQEAKERLKVHLRAKDKVVWDATSLRIDFRKMVTQLGFDYGALVTIVAFQKTIDEYRQGNERRPTRVHSEVLARQLESMQWPDLTESHRMLIIGENDKLLAAFGFFGEDLPYNLNSSIDVLRDCQ